MGGDATGGLVNMHVHEQYASLLNTSSGASGSPCARRTQMNQGRRGGGAIGYGGKEGGGRGAVTIVTGAVRVCEVR